MAKFKVKIIAVGDDGGEINLGSASVEAESVLEAQQKAMDELWDNRLDGASCSARFETTPDDYTEGEVIGLEKDGTVIQWSAQDESPYNSGETLEQFGVDNLTEVERIRVGLPPIAASQAEVDSTCDDCGTEVSSIIGCPDGAEVCQACFGSGAH